MKQIGGILVTAVFIIALVSLADFSAAAAQSVNDHGVIAIKEDVLKDNSDSQESYIESTIVMMESPSPAKPSHFLIIVATPTNDPATVYTVVEYVDIGDKPSRL